MHWVVKFKEHGGQYRVTIPGELVVKADFEGVEYVRLSKAPGGGIIMREYYGKRKEKGDFPEDRSGSD